MTIKNTLINVAESDIQRLKNASRALQYVGFEPVIGFKIEKLIASYREIISYSEFNDNDKEKIRYL